jgi:hypothetical protein
MSACLMGLGFAAKRMVNLRSQIAHWQLTKAQKLRDGRPLLGPQRTGRRVLRRLGSLVVGRPQDQLPREGKGCRSSQSFEPFDRLRRQIVGAIPPGD